MKNTAFVQLFLISSISVAFHFLSFMSKRNTLAFEKQYLWKTHTKFAIK